MWNPLHICSGHLAIVLLTRSTISLQLCQILAISLQLWQLLAISLQFGVRQVGHYPERQTNNFDFPSQILRFILVFVFVSVDAPPLSEFCPRLPWDNHNRWQKNILSPCESRLFWQNQLAELIFKKKKKPRQNWSRGHFETTQKANFQSWNQIFGQVTQRWAWPTGTTQKSQLLSQLLQQCTAKSLFCPVKFLSLPALFWVAFLLIFLGFVSHPLWNLLFRKAELGAKWTIIMVALHI